MQRALSEAENFSVTLLELGPDDNTYDSAVLDPARAPEAWLGAQPVAMTPITNGGGFIPMLQGRMLGGTSAVNGLATLRGLPEDYDSWAAAGLEGWQWSDVVDTFIAAETDHDFPDSPLHGNNGPLPVRRWRREEMGRAQIAFHDGMQEVGAPAVADINDRSQLPGIGIFPVTIDERGHRVTTSLAYLTPEVRSRGQPDDSNRRGGTRGSSCIGGKATGVVLSNGEALDADEIVDHGRRPLDTRTY